MEFCKVTLTFESNESSLPVSYDAICFSQFQLMKFGNLVQICPWVHLTVKGLNR